MDFGEFMSKKRRFPKSEWFRPLEVALEADFPGWEVRVLGTISNPLYVAFGGYGDLSLSVSYNGKGKPGYCWRICPGTALSKPIVTSQEIGEDYHNVEEAMTACMSYAQREFK